jgi:hypothetical protein
VSNGVRVGAVTTGGFPITSQAAVMFLAGSNSSVNMHPTGAHGSALSGVSGNQQVGYVRMASFAQPNHAAVWTGSANSWVDLHPTGADNTSSGCTAVSNGVQVGTVSIINRDDPNLNTVVKAALWQGTAASWVNLHDALPGGGAAWANSYANGVSSDGTTITVVGTAWNNANNRNEAVMWVSIPPGPHCGSSDFNGDGDFGTDQDIQAFFACLAGSCCAACSPLGSDFNGDGDAGTDQDIESFFRVLAGGAC